MQPLVYILGTVFCWCHKMLLVETECLTVNCMLTAMVFVYDFHPGAETMMNRHFGSSPRSSDAAFGNHGASVAAAYHSAGHCCYISTGLYVP